MKQQPTSRADQYIQDRLDPIYGHDQRILTVTNAFKGLMVPVLIAAVLLMGVVHAVIGASAWVTNQFRG